MMPLSCLAQEGLGEIAGVRSVILPRPSTEITSSAAYVYYSGVLGQMHEAALERDVTQLKALLGSHDRPTAPEWFQQRLADFKLQIPVLEFEVHVAKHGSLRLVDPMKPLGAELEFMFSIPAPPKQRVTLLAGDDDGSARFMASIQIEDYDSYGSSASWSTRKFIELPQRLDLGPDKDLQLMIALPAFASEGAFRKVTIVVEWMPGYLRIDGQHLANGRVHCARHQVRVYPAGTGAIRRAPLTTMQNALQLGDAAHFDHIYLAARFMPEDRLSEAQAMLIQKLRLAHSDLARVCMAALTLGADVGLTVDDRLGWLRWWQEKLASRK